MLKVGNTNIGEIYVGSTKIAEAYVGSTLVYQLSAPAGYDSYVVHLTWSGNNTFNMAGLKINGVQATTSQVTSIWKYQDGNQYEQGSWSQVSSSDVASMIDWSNQSGHGEYGTAININFETTDTLTQVQIHTGTWYGGGSMTVTMHVAGVKDGVETDLGYTSDTNSADKTYTINIS